MVFLIQFFYISGISHHFCGYLLSFQCPIAGSVSNSIKSVRLLSLWSSISQNLCIFFHFWWRYHLLSFLPPCSYLHWMFTSVINNCFLGLSLHHYSKNVLSFFFPMLYLAFWIWSHCPSLFFVYSTFWWKTAFSNFSGKESAVDWMCVCVCVCMHVCAQLCLTLCDPMDCSPPGSSVHGILQARILEWVAMPSSRRSSWLRDQTCFSYIACIGRQVLYH